MAELKPAPFADLVRRLHRETARQDALFELPRRRWYLPAPDTPDMSVRIGGALAGNPAGPAAGPHTQMAQNVLLSYIAGGRMIELKTVQVNDQLSIPRPCINMTNVGYNIEWSQELHVEQSLREYVAGAMLIEMFRLAPGLSQGRLTGDAGAYVLDVSVGYDLAGIQSEKIRRFLAGVREPSAIVADLREQILLEYRAVRDLVFPARLSDSITLSTFHGCPPEEIEQICEHLIAEEDFSVVVKMNPPMLGREPLEELLHERMGYAELRVNPHAYESCLAFDEAVAMTARLTRFAARHGRIFGCKFCNTLEVVDQRGLFPGDNEFAYLSGQPLHVLALALVDRFRQAVGPDVPISFSAGIDRSNFALAAACGMAPITVCTDLLRPGGYGRLGAYLENLAAAMRVCGAANVDEFVLKRFDQADQAARRSNEATEDSEPRSVSERSANERADSERTVRWAGLLNTTLVAEIARDEPRYRANRNRHRPRRTERHLELLDCLTCDKCLQVCPNAAIFAYPTPARRVDYHDVVIAPGGSSWELGPVRTFEVTREHQIAALADFCNECGNCDTFCPEHGGPYLRKPIFHSDRDAWARAAPHDGFYIEVDENNAEVMGRIDGREHRLVQHRCENESPVYVYHSGDARLEFDADLHVLRAENCVR